MPPGPAGEFEQQVTIEDFYHERIEVPNIGDTRRATVLHDFNRVCLILSVCHCLNSAVVMLTLPPSRDTHLTFYVYVSLQSSMYCASLTRHG